MNQKRKAPLIAALLIFLALFLIVGCVLLRYRSESGGRKRLAEDLLQIVDNARQKAEATSPAAGDFVPSDPADETEDQLVEITHPDTGGTVRILPEYADVFLLNTDLIGWLKIEGTGIDYPVMQTPDREDYYLRRDFYGNYNPGGTLYADEMCDLVKPSDNLIIYGHNMGDGTMLHDLLNYTDRIFWEQHKTICFDTLCQRGLYEIIAVFKTTGSDGGFPYYQFIDAADEADYDGFIQDVKELSFYDTGLTAHYGDTLLCLSTCEYTLENGRLVVVAQRAA